jgi:hypothetical protein
MAQQIHYITAHAGGPAKVLSGNRIYRLEIPTGFGTEDLMGAVGGGLRTAVRSSVATGSPARPSWSRSQPRGAA